jgi:hypothetical protein
MFSREPDLTKGTEKVTRSNFELKACSLGFKYMLHVNINGRLITGLFSRAAFGHGRVAFGWVALPSTLSTEHCSGPSSADDQTGLSTNSCSLDRLLLSVK